MSKDFLLELSDKTCEQAITMDKIMCLLGSLESDFFQWNENSKENIALLVHGMKSARTMYHILTDYALELEKQIDALNADVEQRFRKNNDTTNKESLNGGKVA